MFNWIKFLNTYRIEYVTSGPNVARGNINIRCVWCGSKDPSHHLGISLQGEGYGCWRNPTHRGKSNERLVAALLNISQVQAKEIVSGDEVVLKSSNDEFVESIRLAIEGNHVSKVVSVKPLSFPPEFRKFDHDKGLSHLFFNYLVQRGYSIDDVYQLSNDYHLYYSIKGPFAYRVIFPVYGADGLLTWTGRAIGKSVIRYRSLSQVPEKAKQEQLPIAKMSIKDTLWNYSRLVKGGKYLFLCEGPFDAMRIDYCGIPRQFVATCTFGKSISGPQVELLQELTKRFDKRYIIWDDDVGPLEGLRTLLGLGFTRIELDHGDPAMLTKEQVLNLV